MKPGYQTTEFWLNVLSIVISQVTPGLPPTWQVVVPAVAGAAYAIARGLTKAGASAAPAA